MKCEYCDNELPAGVAYCPSCGAAVKVVHPTAAPAYAPGAAPVGAVPPGAAPAAPAYAPGAAPIGAVPVGAAPYGAPVIVNMQQPALPPKSRVTYVLLALFLGTLGIHNFYAGRAGSGVAQLLITLLTCGIGGLVTGLWALIEACAVTTDGHGVPFSS